VKQKTEEVTVCVSETEKQVVYGILNVLEHARKNGLDPVVVMDTVDIMIDEINKMWLEQEGIAI
jgi:hypothetical protein